LPAGQKNEFPPSSQDTEGMVMIFSQLVPVEQPTLFPPADYAADPCSNRHGGSETSAQAHERVRPHKRQVYARILALVEARGLAGATVHELAEAMATMPNCISGRLTELRALGRLQHRLDGSGNLVKRRGAGVLELADFPNK
jgi:hypothetical protein